MFELLTKSLDPNQQLREKTEVLEIPTLGCLVKTSVYSDGTIKNTSLCYVEGAMLLRGTGPNGISLVKIQDDDSSRILSFISEEAIKNQARNFFDDYDFSFGGVHCSDLEAVKNYCKKEGLCYTKCHGDSFYRYKNGFNLKLLGLIDKEDSVLSYVFRMDNDSTVLLASPEEIERCWARIK